ncbi:MFS general substrate transporter [Violaceomyces palustris]|uniref:MFS general substrate transporter n=1 Tax=Violaceomyces palustris TaxID=1673888 RepID=A0ACD0P3M8_9BASI|nr:MFS general substrate transporter [Violaceomyces palustris]
MTPEEERALLRKVDLAIVPFVSIAYLLAFLDRINIGQARVYGLEKELGLKGNDFAVALSVFFVGYVAFEIPSNIAFKKLKPARYITFMMLSWGTTMTLMGVVHNAAGLKAARFFLGLLEGGLFPGITFLISCWYPRTQTNLRIALFFSAGALAGAFGGIIAFGISKIEGVAGLSGWRWIFIVEGLATIVIATICYSSVPGFPDEPKSFLSPSESAKWNHHIQKDQGVILLDPDFNWSQVRNAFKDWKTWAYAVMYISIAQPLYSIALFMPTIIKALGFTSARANLLTVPPYVLGFITTNAVGYFSDRRARRGASIALAMSFVVVGYSILISPASFVVKYSAIFLVVAGVSPSIATAITWIGNNYGPVCTRATAMGLFFTTGSSAGLISSNIYPSKESPRFIKGHAISLCFACLAIVLALVLRWECRRQNLYRDQWVEASSSSSTHPVRGGDVDMANPTSREEKEKWDYEHLTDREILELGDKHRGFRYIW